MPIDKEALRRALPGVLRQWNRSNLEVNVWESSLYLPEQQQSDATVPQPETRHKHVQAMIQAALERLAAPGRNPAAAQLLRRHYLQDSQLGQIAAERLKASGEDQPVTPSQSALPTASRRGKYKQSRLKHELSQVRHELKKSLDLLARELVLMEEEAERGRVARIEARLDVERPSRLFGLDGKHAEALGRLRDPQGPRIVALEGLGGLGKTSLASALVRDLISLPIFADILWVNARQEYFSLSEGARVSVRRPVALTPAQLMLELAAALQPSAPDSFSQQDTVASVRACLRLRPYLVVIDNLETVQDYQTLIPELLILAGPSRFLLTSREQIRGASGIYSILLQELNREDLLALVRETARVHGFDELAAAPDVLLAPIYDVAGGNPLAAKLIVGFARHSELAVLLAELREARSRSADELFNYIYWRSWHALSPQARIVLKAMPCTSTDGGALDQLIGITDTLLDAAAVRAALAELVRHSLVEVGGSVQARRYRIHRLTETFLLREVIEWAGEEQEEDEEEDSEDREGKNAQ